MESIYRESAADSQTRDVRKTLLTHSATTDRTDLGAVGTDGTGCGGDGEIRQCGRHPRWYQSDWLVLVPRERWCIPTLFALSERPR